MRELFVTVGLVLACGVGCGDEESTFPKEEKKSDLPPGAQSGFDTSKPPVDACSDAAKLVYVVSQENELFSFTPNLLKFQKIGRLNCPSGTPSSMAVDRSGTAWVSFADGKVGKVSTKDARCTPTEFKPDEAKYGFYRFGMAFSTNGSNTNEETLFISGVNQSVGGGGTAVYEGKGLGRLDTGALALTMIGDYTGCLAKGVAELTGTGDGRLYGFFLTNPGTLAQIDRETGAVSEEKSLGGVKLGNAFAFSFWGGDFWFYTTEGSVPSSVTRLNMQSGQLSVVMQDVGGFRIVGAGVSTCAPLTQPK